MEGNGLKAIDGGIQFHMKEGSEKLLELRSRLLVIKEDEKYRIVIKTSTFALSLDISKEAGESLLKTHEEQLSKRQDLSLWKT